MLMSGTIGWLIVSSQQSPFNVVFFRCVFGGATLPLLCPALGCSGAGSSRRRMLMLALLRGVTIVSNWVPLFAAYSRASISMATPSTRRRRSCSSASARSCSTNASRSTRRVAPGRVRRVDDRGPRRASRAPRSRDGTSKRMGYALGASVIYAVSSMTTKRLQGHAAASDRAISGRPWRPHAVAVRAP